MDHHTVENLFAVVSPGLEEICAEELSGLGLSRVETLPGGVTFSGGLEDIYRANLWSRCASRVWVRFERFRCRAFPDLYRRAVRLPWGRFIRQETAVEVSVTCRRSRLMHGGRLAATLQDAINRALGRPPVATQGPVQRLLAHMVDDELSLSIDSSGELLHRRGYRLSVTQAPLRETLAAGILMLLGWKGTVPLADPMCGTGSFLLEGALLAACRAPGLARHFAFENWPGYREGLWCRLCDEARQQQKPVAPHLEGCDLDPHAVMAAKHNLANLQVEGEITFLQGAFADQPVHPGPGLVVCNPPYGHRLKPTGNLPAFYRSLGRSLAHSYPGWTLALLCPDAGLVKATGLPFRKRAELDNGGLTVGLFVCKK
jgi:putative N6-adenine-specific DNA methylase